MNLKFRPKRLHHQLTALTVAVSLAFAPSLALARDTAGTLNTHQALDTHQIQQGLSHMDSPESTRARYGKSPAELAAKVKASPGWTRWTVDTVKHSFLINFMLVIMIASHLFFERRNIQKLSDGLIDESKSSQEKDATELVDRVLCGNSKKASTAVLVTSEVACNGELWMGFIGGSVLGVASQVLQKVLRIGQMRSLLGRVLGQMTAIFAAQGGFILSQQLWTEAIQVLNDPEKEERAHNLFGRIGLEAMTLNWSAYSKTPDGQLASEVIQNLKNILALDSDLTSTWFYNFFRFGLARGDMLVSLSVLSAGLIGAEAAGSFTVAAINVEGWPGYALAAVISALFLGGFTFLMAAFPDLGIGDSMNSAIQGLRAHINLTQHRHYLERVVNLSNINYKKGSDVDYFGLSRQFDIDVYTRELVKEDVPGLMTSREYLVNVYLEAYWEIQNSLDKAEIQIRLATESIKNSKYKDILLVSDGRMVMTYDQALAKICQIKNSPGCAANITDKIQAIDRANQKLQKGRQELAGLALEILNIYKEDAQQINNLFDTSTMTIPPEPNKALTDFRDQTNDAGDILTYMFGTFNDLVPLYATMSDGQYLAFDSAEKRTQDGNINRFLLERQSKRSFREKFFVNLIHPKCESSDGGSCDATAN